MTNVPDLKHILTRLRDVIAASSVLSHTRFHGKKHRRERTFRFSIAMDGKSRRSSFVSPLWLPMSMNRSRNVGKKSRKGGNISWTPCTIFPSSRRRSFRIPRVGRQFPSETYRRWGVSDRSQNSLPLLFSRVSSLRKVAFVTFFHGAREASWTITGYIIDRLAT